MKGLWCHSTKLIGDFLYWYIVTSGNGQSKKDNKIIKATYRFPELSLSKGAGTVVFSLISILDLSVSSHILADTVQ